LRAGLLSENEVIRMINENYVSTWVLIDDVKSYSGKEQRLAATLASNWEYPLDLMFLTSSGEFFGKLNSFRDFPNAHVDVGHPGTHLPDSVAHSEIFLSKAKELLRFYKARRAAPAGG
jgi:hypothetical protein